MSRTSDSAATATAPPGIPLASAAAPSPAAGTEHPAGGLIMLTVPADLGFGVLAESLIRWGDRKDAGLILRHPSRNGDDGGECFLRVRFALPGAAEAFPGEPLWTVERLEPLTLTEPVECGCGVTGFIRRGVWVPT